MPIYSYECTRCHKVFDSVSSIKDRDNPQECSCGHLALRSFASELSGKDNVDGVMRENERWSWSMGVHVNQIPEMQKRYPGSVYHPKTGQLLVTSRQDKVRKMRERGLTEFA